MKICPTGSSSIFQLLWWATALLAGTICPTASSADGDVSDAAQAVLDRYRLEFCEEAKEVRGQPVSEGVTPLFQLEDRGHRQVVLTGQGRTAEIIYTGRMTCDGGHIGTCGSAGCISHIIVGEANYAIHGGEPFLLITEQAASGAGDADYVAAVIAWYGWGGHCSTQGDLETEPLRDCLLTAYIDPVLRTLTFQCDYGDFPR